MSNAGQISQDATEAVVKRHWYAESVFLGEFHALSGVVAISNQIVVS